MAFRFEDYQPVPTDPVAYAVWRRGQIAYNYHPAVKSFKLGPNQDGREVYARASPLRSGICYLEFTYADDDTRIITRDPQLVLQDTEFPTLPIHGFGEDTFGGWKIQCYIMNTHRRYQILAKGSKAPLASISFHPLVYASEGITQEPGAIVEPSSIIFRSKWDAPVINPSEEDIEKAVSEGRIDALLEDL